MDLSLERDSSALGSLFQQIINDMKNTSPLWEDFVAKASKLHTCLRAAIQAIAAYLDAFQKIADAATNSRGASKEIGTALTRVCLRHKAVETRLKSFTGAIMDCLVQPLQDKIEDWKRTVATIDKDHAKEHKRCRTELKKRSSDTLRLQKKARKGQTDNSLQSLMDSHMQDVTLRRAELEDVEKKSLRAAMIEERLRYCSFVHMLQPVVHEECEVMSELGHLQEAMQSIALVTKEPSVLPQASEELIHVAKASINLYPESPGGGSGSQGGGCSNSLGSRKSSVCSISSMNSSGSSNSPGHHHYQRSLSQFVTPAIRLKPGESSDSGFCSSPALTTQATNASNQTHAVATWPPHSQDVVDTLPPTADRPHTISTTYEKGHQRPPLTVYTFQNPETIHESSSSNSLVPTGNSSSGQNTPATQKSPAATLSRPPLPVKPAHVRCSSLERPLSAQSNHRQNSAQNLLQRQCPSPIPAHITKELSAAHHAQQQSQPQQQQQQQPAPTYVNTCELAAMKLTQQQQQQSTPLLQQQSSIDSISSQHSNDSSTSSLQQQLLLHQQHQQQQQQQQHMNHQQPRSHSISSASSHTASSLHSHASLDSAVATAGGGAAAGYTNTSTTTPSSGCSTPQNHYSPLLTNSPTSTAAGTPSGGSIASGLGFVYQISSPTPPPSAHEPLKITESTATVDSAEADERSRASVLQKASMFEKQAAATTAPNNVPRRSEEIRVAEQQEMGGAGAGAAAALGGSSTRIARRSSINQAKPPPPVRRSSSVTPSPNNSNLLQHQQQMLSNSSEHLPPPPAFMLEAATATYNTTATTATDMPSSALRVSETVRALAALRHQPASPVALRRLQQQQQQHTQQQQQQRAPSLQTTPHTQSLHQSPATSAELDYEAYYNSYMQLHAYANSQQQQQQQQLHYQQQQQPPTPPPYQAPPPADGSFRTSSPSAGGIYAQPKLMSNMSSFRTSSPSPNGHGHAHALPPTQPKANPNLIAQLNARINSKQQQQQQHQQQQHVAEGIYGNAGDNIYMRGGLSMTQQQQQQHIDAAAQQAAQRQQQQQQQQQQQHYTCPPPLEDPPPPPIYSATMPKKMSRAHAAYSSNNSNHHGNSNNSSSSNMSNHMASAYAAASASATLPKNMLHQQQQQQQQQQQRLLQQQQQQQYHQPAGVGNGHANQRSQMPLPQQQQQQLQQRQPPIPSRHSSVQQKIFVSTNPFIQTTAVKFHSPSSVHSTPAASPTCGSLAAAASLASIYGTTARGGGAAAASQQYHQQQQQQQQHYYRDVAGGNNSNGGSVYYASHNNAHAHAHAHTPHMPHVQAQAHHSNYAASTNIEKTGNIRAKTKAEFLENLNAKLAKQGMSGRAFAVRNLINSKALPDPRICHESLMDQIKRGAPLKRNQKINDRSAPKIH
ncbi:chromatin modification-related protein eaf-1 isoform X18 [Drosophila busckii]|uniref:chromatin modification-related protein eaf-1 isoform X18 n=1 Tax=Drosophila busckii TaxID=30019 RepID=UPI00083F2AB1|nr:chromatin modification-related protein eaf-1 isoform X18 [Drosophila busckii]